jgi:hypothetical protein
MIWHVRDAADGRFSAGLSTKIHDKQGGTAIIQHISSLAGYFPYPARDFFCLATGRSSRFCPDSQSTYFIQERKYFT